jgi:hypothetical protein
MLDPALEPVKFPLDYMKVNDFPRKYLLITCGTISLFLMFFALLRNHHGLAPDGLPLAVRVNNSKLPPSSFLNGFSDGVGWDIDVAD